MRFGIRTKIFLFAVLAWAFIFAAYGAYTYRERIEGARRMALSTAELLSREVTADMQLYNSAVVQKALRAGISVEKAYLEKEKSIPVHAEFLREVARAVSAKGGYSVELKSLTPINPESAPRDSFEKDALERIGRGEARHYSFESYGGKESLRYMVSHVAVSQVCVDCHNMNPASPRRLSLGDVAGGIEIVIPVEEEMLLAAKSVRRDIFYGFVVVLSMGIIGLLFLRRVVTGPLGSVVEASSRLAGGDLTASSSVRSRDELGELSDLTNELAARLRSLMEEIRRAGAEVSGVGASLRDTVMKALEDSKGQNLSVEAFASRLEELGAEVSDITKAANTLARSVEAGASHVSDLGGSTSGVVTGMEAVTEGVGEFARVTRGMTASIKEISGNIGGLSSAISRVSSSMNHINAAIKEVGVNAGEAARSAEEAIKDAKGGLESAELTIQGMARIRDITGESGQIIENLLARVKEIGHILDVISEVADETNLLAINAAIIAAQSGEYGKSFSVVANEIKDLAERTAMAAKEVTEIIRSVEAEGARAGEAVKKVVESVEEGGKLSVAAGKALEKIVESAGKSSGSVREIARGTETQAEEMRLVVESVQRVVEMSKRIAASTQDHARGSELVRKVAERVTEAARQVMEAARTQGKTGGELSSVMEEVRVVANQMNAVLKDEGRTVARLLDASQAATKTSRESAGRLARTRELAQELEGLVTRLDEAVGRFKLG